MPLTTYDSFTTNAATASFNVLNTSPAHKRSAAHSVRHIPGGNFTIVQLSGRQEAERSYELYVPTQQELTNMDSCLGLTGTLSYCAGDVTAVLVEYDAGQWYDSDGQMTVKCKFITDAD